MFSQGVKYTFDNLWSGGSEGKKPVVGDMSYCSSGFSLRKAVFIFIKYRKKIWRKKDVQPCIELYILSLSD